jgi:hypothetical protein
VDRTDPVSTEEAVDTGLGVDDTIDFVEDEMYAADEEFALLLLLLKLALLELEEDEDEEDDVGASLPSIRLPLPANATNDGFALAAAAVTATPFCSSLGGAVGTASAPMAGDCPFSLCAYTESWYPSGSSKSISTSVSTIEAAPFGFTS